MKRLCWIVLVASASVACIHGEEVYREIATRQFLSRTVLVADDQFSLDTLLAIADRFKAEVSRTRSFAQLLLARTPAEVAMATGKGMTDVDFRWWLDARRSQRQEPFPIARVTVVGDNCVVQLRGKSGKIDRCICGGTDPLLVRGRLEILEVHPVYTDHRTRDIYDSPIHVTAFLASYSRSAPRNSGAAVWLRLAKLFVTTALTVRVRPDVWFIEDALFPVLYPFQNASTPQLDSSGNAGGWVSLCDADKFGLHCLLARGGATRYAEYDLGGNARGAAVR